MTNNPFKPGEGHTHTTPYYLRRFMYMLLLSFSAHLAQAQLQLFPLQRNSTAPAPVPVKKNTAARTMADVRTLPFWDDFSTPNGLYPDSLLWENSTSIWVNDGMAIDPPTINVATFDGLNAQGLAYNANDVLLTGFTDTLTSQKINLSENEPKPVTPAERSTVFLSFFYQWHGNGEAPDEEDYLLLEFMDDTDQWKTALTINTEPTLKRELFYKVIIGITDPVFFHDAFQFRFRSFGRQSGPFDTWNIDYVYLNKNRNINDLSFPDRSAASAISPLFKPYTAIPYSHFKYKQKKLDYVVFDVQNLKNTDASINYRAKAHYLNYFGDSPPVKFSKTLVASQGVKGTAGDMAPYERVITKLSVLPDTTNTAEFHPDADSIDIKLTMKVISNDSIDAGRFDFGDVNLQVNDTVSATFSLKDYYAYDDGMADFAAGLIQAGNLIAYEFEVPDGVLDTLLLLRGFKIYFPPYGMSSNQTVDFYIYHENPNDPGKPGEVWLSIPAKSISRKGVNEFQYIQFLPAVLIDEKKFYVGWKQPVAGNLLVGLDVNNNTAEKIMVNTTGSWFANKTVRGSLMVRPVFGNGEVGKEVGIDDPVTFSVYPNPTQGDFYIRGQYDRLDIIAFTGQRVPFTEARENDNTRIQLANQPPGLYLLRCTKGAVTKTHKLILSR